MLMKFPSSSHKHCCWRHSFIAVVLLPMYILLLSGCRQQQADSSELAARVAKQYYDLLISGRYEDYVAGIHQPDSIPDSYRSQLIDNAKLFMEQQRQEHQGLKEVSVVSAVVGADGHIADVYLLFTFGDGNTEQVLVPMVERGGNWLMR